MGIVKLDFSRIVGRSTDIKPFLPIKKDVGTEFYESDTRYVYVWNANQKWELYSTPSINPVMAWSTLTDTPNDYTGHEGKVPVVNGTADGLEFYTLKEPSGFELVDGKGFRPVGQDPTYLGPVGTRALDISTTSIIDPTYGGTGSYSITTGIDVKNPAPYALVIGTESSITGFSFYAVVHGDEITVDGYCTKAYGFRHAIVGHYNTVHRTDNSVEGSYNTVDGTGNTIVTGGSHIFGDYCTVTGDNSKVLGYGLRVNSFGEVVVGHYNIDHTTNGSSGTYHPDDGVFTVGAGSDGIKRDALRILNKGLVLAPELTIALITPEARSLKR